jgi:amino acid permease
MVSLGEMIAYLPLPGGPIMLAERFVDSAWAFTLGWIYCTSYDHHNVSVLTKINR